MMYENIYCEGTQIQEEAIQNAQPHLLWSAMAMAEGWEGASKNLKGKQLIALKWSTHWQSTGKHSTRQIIRH